MPAVKGKDKLIGLLNKALAWELRAEAMYAHYAAYLKGMEVLTLKSHFEGEATESAGHAKAVRDIIAQLGGKATTDRDKSNIVHTENWRVMLKEALRTEQAAAKTYKAILPLAKDNPIFMHDLSHIMMDEMKAVVEIETLLGK